MDILRKDKLQYIKDNIDNMDDENLESLYIKITNILPKKYKKQYPLRIDKMLFIESHIRFIDDINLDNLKQFIIDSFKSAESEESMKYRIILEIINKILAAINHDKIKCLTDFAGIRRELILSDDIRDLFNDNKYYIFKNGFNKDNYRSIQSNRKYQHFAILKKMIKELGYDIVSKIKCKFVNKQKTVFTVYNIIKI
jgi:transposase